jgi:anti-sigma factor RsiW
VADHSSHTRHDRFAIADAIGGGALPATIASCPACRALHLDLVTLRGAVRAAWVPRRTRDIRLTFADAARLHRRRWRQLLGMIGTPRDALTRPLALSFTGLGLAGLLLTAVPAGLPMGSTGAAGPELDRTMVVVGSPAPTATAPASTTAGSATTPHRDTVPPNQLPGISIGLLGIGATLFVLRRATPALARGVKGMR